MIENHRKEEKSGCFGKHDGSVVCKYCGFKQKCIAKQSDGIIFIPHTGRKGSGMSTASIAFAEGIAEDIARLRGKGEPPEQFFNLDHIKSISEMDVINSRTQKKKMERKG